VCEAHAFDFQRLQFSVFQIGLSDGQTWTSGQGEPLYMDVTFRRSGIKAYFKYGSKIGRSRLLSGYSFLAVEERVTGTAGMPYQKRNGLWCAQHMPCARSACPIAQRYLIR